MIPVDKFIEINGEEIYITDYREIEEDLRKEDEYEVQKMWVRKS